MGEPNLMSAHHSGVILQQYLSYAVKERDEPKVLKQHHLWFNVATSSQGAIELLMTCVWLWVGRKTPNDLCLNLGGERLIFIFFTFSLMQ